MEYADILPTKYYPEALKIIEEYLPGHDEKMISRMYQKYPSLFIGYFIEGELLGVCFGYPFKEERPDDETVILSGIAVVFPYNAHGRGKIMIKLFEEQVAMLGYDTISVGSANGYAERFYIKNGYIPQSLMISVKDNSYEQNPETKHYKVLKIRQNMNDIKIYVEISDYSVVNPQYMLMMFNGYNYCFIMEKNVTKHFENGQNKVSQSV